MGTGSKDGRGLSLLNQCRQFILLCVSWYYGRFAGALYQRIYCLLICLLTASKCSGCSLTYGLEFADAVASREVLHFIFHGVDELFQELEMRGGGHRRYRYERRYLKPPAAVPQEGHATGRLAMLGRGEAKGILPLLESGVALRPGAEGGPHFIEHDLAAATPPSSSLFHNVLKGHPEPIARTVALEGLAQRGQLIVR